VLRTQKFTEAQPFVHATITRFTYPRSGTTELRIAVISDTHFGDPLCTLVESNPKDGSPVVGPAFEALARAVGQVDYLVLLGDIIDFSVASYADAYRQARCFFRRLRDERLAREIVYVPGNHDFDVRHTVEHQVNVINRLQQGQLPRAFKRSVPGVIDDRRKIDKFLLPDVVAKRDRREPEAHYGNLFFDDITRERRNGRLSGDPLTFNFAYPNLYVVTDEGESLLLTHGHYFEAFWSVAAEWISSLALDDLELDPENGSELTLREVVGINLPLHQLACTGVGQARPFSELARKVQKEIASGRTDSLRKYFERLEQAIRSDDSLGWPRRHLARLAVRWVRTKLLSTLETLEHTRYSREFLTRPRVRERFRQYYRYSLGEIARLSREHGVEIPPPRHVVFGHTHQPIPWEAEELADSVDGHPVSFCNTGGWILKEDRSSLDFVGAEVLLYESGRGVRSVSIRSDDLYPIDTAGAFSRDVQSPVISASRSADRASI
jgi:UDP-2,3-diacylglucosamine pyrophosphatase LpxH